MKFWYALSSPQNWNVRSSQSLELVFQYTAELWTKNNQTPRKCLISGCSPSQEKDLFKQMVCTAVKTNIWCQAHTTACGVMDSGKIAV